MMNVDFQVLTSFYNSSVGKKFSQSISSYISHRLNVRNKLITSLGYTEPFINSELLNNNIWSNFLPSNYVVDESNLPSGYTVISDITHLPVKAYSQDIFITFNTIEYYDNINPIFSEIRKCLKDGGLLIIITPLVYNVYNLLEDSPIKLAQRFTQNNLLSKLETNSFLISKTDTIPITPTKMNKVIKRFWYKYFSAISSILVVEALKKTPICRLGGLNDCKSTDFSPLKN